jgi:ABC-type multidrug transport system ATPase subunit
MKQKLALCCALIHAPEVLFLDEPTTGVDAVSRKEFWEMLGRLKEKGITMLVSTPYMDEASLCDRVALITEGEILQIDTPKAIEAAFPRKLFGISGGDAYSLIKALRTDERTASVHAFGDSVHFTSKMEDVSTSKIQEILAEKGYANDLAVNLIQPQIEDCFIELMGQQKGVNA